MILWLIRVNKLTNQEKEIHKFTLTIHKLLKFFKLISNSGNNIHFSLPCYQNGFANDWKTLDNAGQL